MFDTTGGNDLATSFAAAGLNGQVVVIVASYQDDLTPIHIKGLSLHAVFMPIPMLHDIGRAAYGDTLRKVAALVDNEKLQPLIDPEPVAPTEIAAAHRKQEEGRTLGKLVIDVTGCYLNPA